MNQGSCSKLKSLLALSLTITLILFVQRISGIGEEMGGEEMGGEEMGGEEFDMK